MDYSFRPYLEELDRNWYRDDDLLRRLLGRHRGRHRFDGGGADADDPPELEEAGAA